MVDRADQFLMSLSNEERTRATFDFESDERERFHFVPPETFERHGFPLEDMSTEQRDLAHALLSTGLSQRGHMTANEIIELEAILEEREGGGQFSRDPDLYFVSVFGTPSTDGTWAWRFEGHHLSLHFTIVDGGTTVSSPTFLAASPAEVTEGRGAGLRPLGALEDAGRALLASLDAAQRDVAIIQEVAPTNIVSGVELAPDPLSPVGIVGSELTPTQRDLLMEVIEFYTGVMSDDIAAARRAKIEDDGVDNITFAWAGGTGYGDVSYFRVQGPSFLIEFDHTQRDPNHIHSGWRDFDGDFGRDLLREHLAVVEH
ncbi:MAG: DUF3500 domain-containing protein [Gemmatimonadetes bacterium]|nr:DUF3500 domain-containing protein [Gemmatimonadota bacterium]